LSIFSCEFLLQQKGPDFVHQIQKDLKGHKQSTRGHSLSEARHQRSEVCEKWIFWIFDFINAN